MNRKLHNSLMALSTTGLLLVLGLMAATPVVRPATMATIQVTPARAEVAVAESRGDEIDSEIDARIESAIDARARAFETEFRNASDAHQAIAATAAFVAETATEAALTAALAELQAKEPAAETEAPAREAPRRHRSARSALALPYFSFARGLRGGNGD
jgi:hypothetical protein